LKKSVCCLFFTISLLREDDDGDDETTDFAQQCHLSELNSNYFTLFYNQETLV
jgi:hypothetical protein